MRLNNATYPHAHESAVPFRKLKACRCRLNWRFERTVFQRRFAALAPRPLKLTLGRCRRHMHD